MHALVVGRFQPLHKGHVAVIRAALDDADEVTVVIGSSEAEPSWKDPFSVAERTMMLRAAFPAETADGSLRVVAVPDLFDPPRWVESVTQLVPGFDLVVGNDDWTLGLFKAIGKKVRSPGFEHRDEWHASRIRRQLADGIAAWRDAVPEAVLPILENLQAPARLRGLADGESDAR
jgi:nicotinamide-nucleotide adenylyltransferase